MDNVPIVLAQYRLGKTLGIGAFGKVKCTFNYMIMIIIIIIIIIKYNSGPSYYHWIKSGC